MTAGEDTTAQLRDQIAAAAKQVQLRLGPNAIEMAQRGTPIPLNGTEADLVASAVLPIVLAQVEAAKATARREALTAVLAVPYCRDVGHTEAIHSAAGCCDPYEDPCAAMAACQYPADRCGECGGEPLSCEAGDGTDCPFEPSAGGASAQGVTPPAEVIATAVIPANTIKVGDRINFKRPGGQGAQSSGHECCPGSGVRRHQFTPDEWNGTPAACELCNHSSAHPIHQRGPGQPGEQDTAEETP